MSYSGSDTEAPPSQLTITLEKPITFEGREYATITLQHPTGKQVLRGDEQLRLGVNAMTLRLREFFLISAVSGVPVPVIEQMRYGQLQDCMRYLQRFLSDGPPIGPF